MKKRIIYSFLVSMAALFAYLPSYGSHVAGGNMTYQCLGDNLYRITLEFRRDCFNGNPLAQFDDPASIGIFDGNGNIVLTSDGGEVQIEFNESDTLNQILTSECEIQGDDVCVEMTTYSAILTLPFNSDGYVLAYQRCCRNISLNNILDPTNQGSTYYVFISAESQLQCNSAPVFNEWPSIYICANEELVFDHSATDVNGDSLVYRLCAPSVGGTQINNMPQPPAGPPYSTVAWQSPYSLLDMMGGVPLSIDPATGILTATPNLVGQFLIGICVDEYRDGELIGFTRRDFEYNVRVCDPHPVATIIDPDFENCVDLSGSFSTTVSPTNAEYQWFVVDGTDTTFYNQNPNLNINFPSIGSYIVGVAARDGSCVDTTTIDYYVAEEGYENIDIEDPGIICVDTVTLTANADPGATFEWYSDANLTNSLGTGSPINVSFSGGSQTYYVSQTDALCPEIDSIVVIGNQPDVFITQPPSNEICLNEEYTIEVINNDPSSMLMYTWGGDGMLTTLQGLPTASFVFTNLGIQTITLLIVTQDGCEANYSFNVNSNNGPELNLQDSLVVCYGETLVLNPGGNVDFDYIWTSDNPSWVFNANDASPEIVNITSSGTMFLEVVDPNSLACLENYEMFISVTDQILNIDNSVEACFGEDLILNPNGDASLTYVWTTTNTDWIFDANAVSPVITNIMSSGVMTVEVSNGTCTENYEIIINVADEIILEVSGQTVFCEFSNVVLEGIANQSGTFVWTDLLDGTVTNGSTFEMFLESSRDIELVFTGDDGCMASTIVTLIIQEDFDLSVTTSTGAIYCEGEEVTMTANYSGVGDVTWINGNGDVIGMGDQIIVNPIGVQSYTVSIENGDCLDSVVVPLSPSLIDITVNYPPVVCMEETVTIEVINNVAGSLVYAFELNGEFTSTQSNTITVFVDQDITGSVTVINQDSCNYQEAINIIFDPIIDFEIMIDPDVVNIGETAELTTNGDPNWTYSWEPAGSLDDPTSPTPIATPMDSTTVYSVTVTNENGCMDSDSISVRVRFPQCNSTDVFVPNLFTPNGDNFNDTFKPESNFIDEMTLVVYDRWGEKVFETSQVGAGWDGTFNGAELDPDVFGYCLSVLCINGNEYTTQGSVTLMK